MTEKITRRQFSTRAAGAVVAAYAGFPLHVLAEGVTSMKIGDIDVTTISDGHYDLPNSWFFNADAETLSAAGDPITIGANLWIVRTGRRVVMIDTGAGPVFADSVPTSGKLDSVLAAGNIAKGDITDIVITHMHLDHIGGLMGKDAGGFGNARIHMAAAEWAYWMNPELNDQVPDDSRQMVQVAQSIMAPLEGRIEQYHGETDLGDGLTLVPLFGHTPGHMGVRIRSNGQELLVVADAVVSELLQFRHPNIHYVLDVDPVEAAETRIAMFDMLADTGTLFSATHLGYPGIGRVRRDDGAFNFIPLD